MNKTSISFYTLGCRLNQSETATIQQTFKIDGYDIVDFNEGADLVVINTCTVTEGGDAETHRLVQKAVRNNPRTRIALIGCQAQIQKERLAQHPNVKWVVGNAKKMDLKNLIASLDRDTTHVITPSIERAAFTQPVAAIDEHHKRANIKIQDGCDFFCSFCEIPYARGRARSRIFDDILHEARALAQAGHQEIVITGINVGTYHNDGKQLLELIRALEDIESLQRLRISSIEPTTIPFELIQRMAKSDKLCPYVHIPLQSASNAVLSAMKRKYTFEEFLAFIQRAKETIADICIGTDVIVGFPGETDALFKETEERLCNSPLDYFHVFSYSERSMAKSRSLSGKISPSTINERSRLLRELSTRKRLMFYQSLVGTTQRVIFEGQKNGWWNGLCDNYARVHVKSGQNLTNTLAQVRVEKIDGEKLLASVIASKPTQ